MRNGPPDLAELLRDPARLNDLPPEAIPTLLCQLAAVQTALVARLTGTSSNGRHGEAAEPGHTAGDRFLTAEEAAETLKVTPKWLYRHAKRLPFTRRLSRKCLRFSETGLQRWLAAKKA